MQVPKPYLVAVLISVLSVGGAGEGKGEMRFCGVLSPLDWLSSILSVAEGYVGKAHCLGLKIKERRYMAVNR